MLKCVIIDDEQPARMLIAEYIKKVPSLELVGEFKNPIDAMVQFPQLNVDLLFLDIQMPGLTGLEFLRTLNHKPAVILTTAYSQYALESYDLDVVDYLMKPISFERFLKAVNKTLSNQQTAPISQSPSPTSSSITVKSDGRVHRIYLEEILYVEGLKEYVSIYTAEGRIITLESLKNLEEKLSAPFLRVHKSFIVNTEKISSHSNHDLMIGSKKIPIGSSYRDQVLNKLF